MIGNKTNIEVQRGINRMRRLLLIFDKLDKVDRWFVLTHIIQKDDPYLYKQVCKEN